MAAQVKEKRPLLVFAHSGEAQSFLSNSTVEEMEFPLATVYQSRQDIFLIGGEGYLEILPRLAAFLAVHNSLISRLVNLGVAGTLNPSLGVNQLVAIKTVSLEADLTPKPLSTHTPDAQYHCITAMQRVIDDRHAQQLAQFADLVDREAWAICKIARLFNLPVHCWKLISDVAGTPTKRVNFRAESRRWSNILWELYCQKRHLLSQP